MELSLTFDEKRILLDIARAAIAGALFLGGSPQPVPESPALREQHGAFVTLHTREPDGPPVLRGCIGYIEAVTPLAETVARAARAAAFQDPRFPALAAAELASIEIEVSVLSRPESVRDPADVVPGLHGVIMKKGARSGLLLPQVASERGWDRETLLEHTCLKAGLPRSAWREEDTAIEIFTAVVFNEADLGPRSAAGGSATDPGRS